MNDELQNEEESRSTTSENTFPDGIGLSIEDVKALVAKENKTILDNDEPMLITVTILNAFLYENDKLNRKYHEALRQIYSEQTQLFIQDVEKSTVSIAKSLENVSVEGLHEIHIKNTTQLTAFRRDMLWLSTIAFVSAIINVCVFIFR